MINFHLGDNELNNLRYQWEPLLAPEIFAIFFPDSKIGNYLFLYLLFI